MREAVGLIAVHGGFLAVGAGLLLAAGIVPLRPLALVRAGGLAYLAGIAVVVPLLILLLTLGVPVALPAIVAVFALSALGLVVVGLRREREDEHMPGAAGWAGRIAVAVLGAYLLLATLAFNNLPTIVDDASFWSPKALALLHYDHLQLDVFAGERYVHPDYPILQPLLDATIYRARGGPDLAGRHAELWIVFAAFIAAAAFLVSRAARTRFPLWLPAAGALAVGTGVSANVTLGYADVTLGAFLALGVLCLALWLDGAGRGHLALGAVMLGAAANVKAEGLFLALVALAVAGAVALAQRDRAAGRPWRDPGLRAWAPAALGALAMALPWRLWLKAEGVRNEDVTPLGTALRPSFLIDRADKLREGLEAVAKQLADQGRWSWLFPALLVAAGLALAERAWRHLGVFYLATALGSALLFVGLFWTDTSDPTVPFIASVDRYVTSVVFIAAVALMHLCTRAGSTALADQPEVGEGPRPV